MTASTPLLNNQTFGIQLSQTASNDATIPVANRNSRPAPAHHNGRQYCRLRMKQKLFLLTILGIASIITVAVSAVLIGQSCNLDRESFRECYKTSQEFRNANYAYFGGLSGFILTIIMGTLVIS